MLTSLFSYTLLLFIFQGTLPWSECPNIANALGANVSDSKTALVQSELLAECEKSSETQFF